MKNSYFVLLLFITVLNCCGQNFELKLVGLSEYENKVLDSLQYLKNHQNIKSAKDEINKTSESLTQKGYIENQFIEKKTVNDSVIIAKFNLGKRTNYIHIYIGDIKNVLNDYSNVKDSIKKPAKLMKELLGLNTKKDTLKIPYLEIESFLNKSLQKLEQQGYAFSKLKLINLKKHQGELQADLQYEFEKQRIINAIVIKLGDKNSSFPKGHLAQLNRKYRNNTLNKSTINSIYEDFENFRFTKQLKYPEILFTKDSTKLYVYLNNRKSNTFDGFIGFANNNSNKIRLNGYLDVTLENVLKSGEQFSLYWKSNGNDQKTFKTGIEIPYLFKSPFGLETKINIFKQDSTFQNTKTEIDLAYYINYNTRVYLGYLATESSDIQNTNNTTLSDYKNSFYKGTLEYLKQDSSNLNFPVKSKLSFNFGLGKRTANEFSTIPKEIKQVYSNLQLMHNFNLDSKNYININYQNYFLKSDTYIINELFRFGGINSIRGFTENDFQANFLSAFQSEYRHIVSPSLYVHSILDYSYFEDLSSNNKGNLIGIGLGIGLNTKTGMLKLSFANGINKNQPIKLYNTIIHVNYNVEF